MDDFIAIWDNQYKYDNNITINIHEDLDAGLGGTLFDGSIALAQYLNTIGIKQPEVLDMKLCIELGAGTGLPGLLCAKLGAQHVLLTDMEQVVPLLEENIEKNQLNDNNKARALPLDWTKLSQDFEILQQHGYQNKSFDIILAADTIYQKQLVEPFLLTCDLLLKENGMIYFSHPRPRVPEASEYFFSRVGEWFDMEKIDPRDFIPGLSQDSKQFKKPTEGVFILRRKQKR
jgi:predicted nicotinamide N-methyase